jgi:hypothetical protein
VTMQDVQLEYFIHIPSRNSHLFRASSPHGRASCLAPATAALLSRRSGWRHSAPSPFAAVALAVGLVLGLTLTGCEMLTDFWGDIYGRCLPKPGIPQ